MEVSDHGLVLTLSHVMLPAVGNRRSCGVLHVAETPYIEQTEQEKVSNIARSADLQARGRRSGIPFVEGSLPTPLAGTATTPILK